MTVENEELRLAIGAWKGYMQKHPEKRARLFTFDAKQYSYDTVLEEMEKGSETGRRFAVAVLEHAYLWGELKRASTIPDALANYLDEQQGKIAFVVWGPRGRHMEPKEIAEILRKRQSGYEEYVNMYLQTAFEMSGI